MKKGNHVNEGTAFFNYADMLGTLTPLVLFPNEMFHVFPILPSLEGQYVTKNLVLSAGIVIGATVRGGRIVAEPGRKRV